MVLGYKKIGGAVVVEVSGNDRARVFELNFVEAHVGGDVFESIRPKITKQAHFAFAVFCLADGDEVNPAIVVVIESSDAEGTGPVSFRKFHLLEGFAVIVAPKSYAGHTKVSKCEIHPAVVVEVERR